MLRSDAGPFLAMLERRLEMPSGRGGLAEVQIRNTHLELVIGEQAMVIHSVELVVALRMLGDPLLQGQRLGIVAVRCPSASSLTSRQTSPMRISIMARLARAWSLVGWLSATTLMNR